MTTMRMTMIKMMMIENNLEAVAGEHNGLLMVAPQTALYHVRLQLNIDDIKIGLN